MSERPLFNSSAEQAVLGALLLDNLAFDRIGDKLATSDFYVAQHRAIYAAMRELMLAGKRADVVSLSEAMQIAGVLNNAGGIEYLGELLQATPGAANVEHYAQIVRDRALERALVTASDEISELARASGPVSERMDRAQSLVLQITENAVEHEPRLIRPILVDLIEDLEYRNEHRGELRGLSTSIGELDKRLSGLVAGQLIVVAGRPSMGKSSLAFQIGVRAACDGKSVLGFSLEMSATELAEKAVANIGKIPLDVMRDGSLDGDHYERISAAMGRMHDAKFIIDDSPGMSVEQMRARARRVKREFGLDLVIVDYLQLMQGDGVNRVDIVSEITRGLKILARELGVPVIALSQLNRNCEQRPNKRPVMSDLRESGSIEQDADVVIFIYRDEVYDEKTEEKGIAELHIAKQRMGAVGTVYTTWIGEYGFFGDTEWKRAEAAAPSTKKKAGHDADF